MPGPKTNEREGTRAVLRYAGTSAFKVRQVLDAVRGKPVHEAADLLRFIERGAAETVAKVLQSAVANAANNDQLDPEELYISAAYADEGPTAKRWRPRARGRATRIRKRSCHITIIVSRMPEAQLARLRARRQAENLAMRQRRVEATRRARSEGAEGASRRERRHPEAFAPAAEEAAEQAELEPTSTEATEAGTSAAEPGAPETEAEGLEAQATGEPAESSQAGEAAPASDEAETGEPGTGGQGRDS